MYKELARKCRICSNTPFGSLFGILMGEDDNLYDKNGSVNSPDFTFDDNSTDDEEDERTAEELQIVARNWESYVHSRATQSRQNRDDIYKFLEMIGKGCGKSDPIFDKKCVLWKGELSKETNDPIITYKVSDSSAFTYSYVNRLLVYLFAGTFLKKLDEESFLKLKDRPKEPFKMMCGNKLCVNLTHVLLGE